MDENELRKVLDKLRENDEVSFVEVKLNLRDLSKIGETISALANSASWKNEKYGYFIWGLENATWKVVGTKFDLKKEKCGGQDAVLWLYDIGLSKKCFEIYDFVLEGQKLQVLKIDNCKNEPVKFQNESWIRINSHNQKLDKYPDIEREIWLKKADYDWSAQICEGATVEDLDMEAVEVAKKLWYEKTGNKDISNYSTQQILLGLFDTEKILKATLILFGTKQALDKYNINTEISFEYRKSEKQIEYDDRRDYQKCFLREYNAIWEKIDARNEVYRFQKGLVIDEIKKFNEVVIREAVLNAVTHRDYESSQASSQVFIKQSENSIIFENPGKLPIDPQIEELVQYPSTPRNKKLAEAFQKLRLTNRAGMGIDLIVQRTIQEGKGIPEYTNFHDQFVFLKLNANLQNKEFLSYLYKVSKIEQYEFCVLELLALENILESGNTSQNNIKNNLLKRGFVENSGAGNGSKLILSKKYYENSGDDRTKYTIQIGLDEESCKQIIIKHLEHFSKTKNPVLGPELYKLVQKVSNISERTFHRYLQKMISSDIIKKRHIGKSKIEYKLWTDRWTDS